MATPKPSPSASERRRALRWERTRALGPVRFVGLLTAIFAPVGTLVLCAEQVARLGLEPCLPLLGRWLLVWTILLAPLFGAARAGAEASYREIRARVSAPPSSRRGSGNAETEPEDRTDPE